MNKLEFKEILQKYRERKYTREELNKIWDFIFDRKNEELIKEQLIEELQEFEVTKNASPNVDFQGIFHTIESRIGQTGFIKDTENLKKRSFAIGRLLRIAAILILVFISGGALSYFMFNPQKEPSVIAFNEIRAPLGARSEIILPDGSQVWLNAGSKLKYLNVFNKTNRMVSLEGEGYFKVAKNSKLPFNVKAGDLYIVALGTEFNVKSYSDEGIIETTLVEGKVSIRQNSQNKRKSQTVYLGPHQKAVYVKEDQQLTVEDLKAVRQSRPEVLKLKKGIMYVADKIDPEPIVSWKDNRLILKGEELSNLLIKLERKYDVTFLYESDNIKQFRFTGTLEDETLTQVLDVIKLSAPIDYALDGKIVRITENKLMTKKFSGHLKKK